MAVDLLAFDPDDMTIGEMMEMEAITGVDISVTVQKWDRTGKDAEGKDVTPEFSAKEMLAMLFIATRRQDPTFTVAQAKEIKIRDLSFGPKDEPEPAAG